MESTKATRYAAPSPQVLRFMEGVRLYCEDSQSLITPSNLLRAQEQIALALSRRRQTGVSPELTDHTIIPQSTSSKITNLIDFLRCVPPHPEAPSLSRRVST